MEYTTKIEYHWLDKIVVSIYYMYGIKIFSFTDYTVGGQKIMNEQATSICCA